MKQFSSADLKKLRGLAHHLNPVVWVGQQGISEALVKSTDEALLAHELIKVKFGDVSTCRGADVSTSRKTKVTLLAQEIADKTGAVVAGVIGHIAIVYREHPDIEKRKILNSKR